MVSVSPILGRRRDRYQADSAGTSISTETVIATHTPIWGITIVVPYSFAIYPSEQRDTALKPSQHIAPVFAGEYPADTAGSSPWCGQGLGSVQGRRCT